MFRIQIAGYTIELDNRYSYVEWLCRDYVALQGSEPSLFRVRVSESDIRTYVHSCGRAMSSEEGEAQLLYRRICEHMPLYDAILIHASAVESEGRGYLFSAPRGTGKTTHTNLWLRHFQGRATVINGDKPLIRRHSDGRFWIYGTPWCGKEGLQKNRRVPLTAICFLRQGLDNCILPASLSDTTAHLLESTILPPNPAAQDRMAALIGSVVRTIPAYTLTCRPDTEAAEMAYEILSQV